jgi:hypothetical protein
MGMIESGDKDAAVVIAPYVDPAYKHLTHDILKIL